ncbi:MAG: PQQ-like beta-propeller repeat protein [Clostridiales bacterium]|nr:PQQ-like beta-propeller repeat protein [Clostridiales bacterium]
MPYSADLSSLFKKFRLAAVIFSVLSLIVTLPFTGLTYLIDTGYKGQEMTGKTDLMFFGALAASQGITTDGENFYFSSKFGFLKTASDGKTWLDFNIDAIPKELKEKYGSSHIGGISWFDGNIFAAVEDTKNKLNPLCVVYDAETLDYSGTYFPLSSEKQIKGCPFVAVDGKRELFYSTQRDHAPCLICYDITTGELVKTVALTQTVHKIQGGEVCDGMLYVASNDEAQGVYRIDPTTGDVVKLFDRRLVKGSEGEGITALKRDGKILLYEIDMGPLFINAFLRSYTLPDIK